MINSNTKTLIMTPLVSSVIKRALLWLLTLALVPSAQSCGKKNVVEELSQLQGVWMGVERDGFSVPRKNQSNFQLRIFDRQNESFGEPIVFFEREPGVHFVQGRISHFGGSQDGGVKRLETGALTGEKLKSLDTQRDYYLAMRFSYGKNTEQGAHFFKDRKFLVVNPKTMEAVVARAIDWGPHIKTKRIIDTSLAVMSKLNLATDDHVWVSFADASAPLGPVSKIQKGRAADGPKTLDKYRVSRFVSQRRTTSESRI